MNFKKFKIRPDFLKFSSPHITKEDIYAVSEALKSGWLTSGEKTQLFEEKFAEFIGSKYAVAVSSCTAALFLSLVANDVKPGDEVITTTFTFVSTVNVIHHLGAIPILVDIKEEDFNIDPLAIQKAISTKTKAIIPVHYSGNPCEMKEINDMAKKNNIAVIEDAAHAIGAEYDGKNVGSEGNLTCFSLFPTKNITTGEGGVITLNDVKIKERLLKLRLHGMSKDGWKRYRKEGSWYYEIQEPGYKYNMSDINAALGLSQINKIEYLNKRRASLVKIYSQELDKIDGIKFIKPKPKNKSSWHIFPIWINQKVLGLSRNELINELWKRNIGTSVHFIPVHYQPFYQQYYGYKKGDFPVAEKIFEGILSLPLYPGMKDEDVFYVTNAIKDIIKHHP